MAQNSLRAGNLLKKYQGISDGFASPEKADARNANGEPLRPADIAYMGRSIRIASPASQKVGGGLETDRFGLNLLPVAAAKAGSRGERRSGCPEFRWRGNDDSI